MIEWSLERALLNDLVGCMQGVTRLLLTTIPYFKEVIIMSFRCEHCGTSNNEIQSAGSIRRASAKLEGSGRHSHLILGQRKVRFIPPGSLLARISTDNSSNLPHVPS